MLPPNEKGPWIFPRTPSVGIIISQSQLEPQSRLCSCRSAEALRHPKSSKVSAWIAAVNRCASQRQGDEFVRISVVPTGLGLSLHATPR